MNQAILIILMLLIGFLCGVIVSCSTLIAKIERTTHTNNVKDAIKKINNLTHNINKMSKEVNKCNIQVSHLAHFAQGEDYMKHKKHQEKVQNNRKR